MDDVDNAPEPFVTAAAPFSPELAGLRMQCLAIAADLSKTAGSFGASEVVTIAETLAAFVLGANA